VLTTDTDVHWTLTTSRRTPASFLDAWRASGLPGDMIPCNQTPPGWMQQTMQRTGRVWVTCESMSMVFEALTAGAAVGLLELPARRHGRVYRSALELIEKGHATPWSQWRAGTELQPLPHPLCEADRCAEEVIRRFLPQTEDPARAA
jgi:mitochondrial fission protein ELM1